MRRVGQLLRNPQHSLAGCFTDARPSMQRAVHGPDRDFGQLCDLMDARSFHGYFATTSSFPSIKSTELPPTITLNDPGSTTRCISRLKNESSSGPSMNSTVFVSPGLKVTRRKPRSSLIGLVTELTSSRM